jgi:hypothetical protein
MVYRSDSVSTAHVFDTCATAALDEGRYRLVPGTAPSFEEAVFRIV